MTTDWQLTEVPVGGVDMLTDPMRVAAPKVLAADNVVLDMPGRARKRAGTRRRAMTARVAPGTTAAPQSIQELVLTDVRWLAADNRGRIFAHADNLLLGETGGQWTVRGMLDQVRITSSRQHWDDFPIQAVDAGFADGVQIVAWLSRDPLGGSFFVTVSLLDAATGMPIHRPLRFAGTVSSATAGGVRVVSLGNGCAMVLWHQGSGVIKALPVDGATIRTSSPTSLVPFDATADAATSHHFDAVALRGRVVLAYLNNAGNIGRLFIDLNGAVGSIQSEAPGGTVSVLTAAAADVNGRFLIAWVVSGGGSGNDQCRARDYASDANLTPHAAIRNIYQSPSDLVLRVAVAVRGTTWTILFGVKTITPNPLLEFTRSLAWETVGNTLQAPAGFGPGILRSKPWRDPVTDRWYVCFAWDLGVVPAPQVTYFVYSFATGGAAAGTYDDVLSSFRGGFNLVGIVWPGFAGGLPATGLGQPVMATFLPNPVVNGRSASIGLTYRAEQSQAGLRLTSRVLSVEHGPSDLGGPVQGPDGALYVPGGVLYRIDDARDGMANGDQVGVWSVSEAGFALGPDRFTAAVVPGGALTAGASYAYRAYFRDLATGERSTAFTFAFLAGGAGNQTLNLNVGALPFSLRSGSVAIDIFRTIGNPVASDPFFLLATIAVGVGTGVASFPDGVADTVIRQNARDYLSFGEVGELAPPANQCVAMGQGIAAVAGLDDEGTVWLSKPRKVGEPLRFSDELASLADHSSPGPITALAWEGTILVVWRARSIQILAGQGPTATGDNSKLEPQRVVSDQVGCRSARTLVRLADGWVFQSSDGTYWKMAAVGTNQNAGELQYIGQMVEPLNEACVAAVAVHPDKQVRFVTAQRTLIYQYDTGEWTISSRSAVAAAALPDGTMLYMPSSTSALLLQEDASLARDDGAEYRQRVRLAWFRPAGVAGEIQVRRVLFAGGLAARARAMIRLYYDYELGHNETFIWDAQNVVGAVKSGDGVQVFGGPSRLGSTQVFQFAVPVARERCIAIGVEILDRSVGGAEVLGDSFWLSAVGYEWAPVEKQGSEAYRLEQRRLAT